MKTENNKKIYEGKIWEAVKYFPNDGFPWYLIVSGSDVRRVSVIGWDQWPPYNRLK
jgi:hypothetical protein